MTTSRYLWSALVALILVALSDMLWHGWLMAGFYNAKIAALGGAMPNGLTLSVSLFYIITALGTAYFVLASNPKDWLGGLYRGALLGLMITGAINLIDNMLLSAWDWNLVIVDTAWGVVTGAIVGAAIVLTAKKA